jgi:hypothetical protein
MVRQHSHHGIVQHHYGAAVDRGDKHLAASQALLLQIFNAELRHSTFGLAKQLQAVMEDVMNGKIGNPWVQEKSWQGIR